MDPVTLILTALVTGATIGIKDAANSAVKDSYEALKGLVIRNSADAKLAEQAIKKLESEPEGKNEQLELILQNFHQHNEDLVNHSARFLAMINQTRAESGSVVSISNSEGVVLGNRNNVAQNFNPPEEK